MLHLPVRGTGDGGIYSTVDDLHRFWRSLVAGQIVGPDLVQTMITPRNVSHEEEKLRYGLGCWLHPTGRRDRRGVRRWSVDALIDDPATETTATVLANSSEGAWRVAWKLVEMFG